MNKYMDALWELKLRVDAHDMYDRKAEAAFNILKKAIDSLVAFENRKSFEDDNQHLVETLRKHATIVRNPDLFFKPDISHKLVIEFNYSKAPTDWENNHPDDEEWPDEVGAAEEENGDFLEVGNAIKLTEIGELK